MRNSAKIGIFLLSLGLGISWWVSNQPNQEIHEDPNGAETTLATEKQKVAITEMARFLAAQKNQDALPKEVKEIVHTEAEHEKTLQIFEIPVDDNVYRNLGSAESDSKIRDYLMNRPDEIKSTLSEAFDTVREKDPSRRFQMLEVARRVGEISDDDSLKQIMLVESTHHWGSSDAADQAFSELALKYYMSTETNLERKYSNLKKYYPVLLIQPAETNPH